MRPEPTDPLRRAWPSYVAIATVGYVIYGIGASTPYLRATLGLTDAQLGLHSTAIAVGLLLVGAMVSPLDRRFGEVAVRAAAIAVLAVAVVGLATALSLAVTLTSAFLVGAGTGTLLGYGNATLVGPGGAIGRVRIARANVWAMVAAFVCPVLLAGTATAGVAFGWGLVPALGLLAILAADLRAGPRLRADGSSQAPTRAATASRASGSGSGAAPGTAGAASAAAGGPADGGRAGGEPGAGTAAPRDVTDRRRLPRAYWLAWLFLIAAIAVEFSIVQWAATLIERQTEADVALATLLAGLFLGGMFVGRLVQSAGVGTRGGVRRPAAIGATLALVGVVGAWLATDPAFAGIAIFVAGLGVAGLYPLGVAAALSTAPDRLALAGSRLTLASGLAVLVAPLALGLVADAAGVVTGWALVVGAAAAALILVAALPAGEPVP